MPSWQSRCFAVLIPALARREQWGDERALAVRARRVFGAPAPYARAVLAGLRHQRVRETTAAGPVTGEWIVPAGAPERSPARSPGVIFYVHGGGFVSCSTRTHRPIASALARASGRRVFSVDYRLAPEHRLPAAHDDVVSAFRWLTGSGVPAGAIAIVGDSAGGNLVLSLAIRLRDAGEPAPACMVMYSPWTDLSGSGASVRENDGRCAMFRTRNIADFAAAALGQGISSRSAADASVSPLFARLHALPPALLHVGSTELLLDDARGVHDRIQRDGGRSTLAVFDGAPHCWQMLAPWVPEANRSIRETVSFIDRHT